MATPTIRTLLLLTLFFCCTLINAAFDLPNTPWEPRGNLKVRLDLAFAKKVTSTQIKDHHWMVSSHLTLKEGQRLSYGQLIKLAIDAYNEIDTEIRQYVSGRRDLPKATPGAMNVLAFGQEIILVSSYKGGSDFVTDFPDSEMSRMLEQCTSTFQRAQVQTDELDDHQPGVGTSHRTGAHCGEITGYQLYSRRYPAEPLRLRNERPRSTTVAFDNTLKTVRPIPECGLKPGELEEGRYHGCDWIVKQQRVNYLREGTPLTYDIRSIERFGQLQICD